MSLIALLLLALTCCEATEWHSARCERSHHDTARYSCEVAKGEHASADAVGSWQDTIDMTGWSNLLVRTRAAPQDDGAEAAAFSAGYLEGHLTAHRVVQHLSNARVGVGGGVRMDPLPEKVAGFLRATDAWTRDKVARADPDDEYWNGVRFVLAQLDGLQAGVNEKLAKDGSREQLDKMDLMSINMLWELEDINLATNVASMANFSLMSAREVSLYVRQRTHCSSIVKLLHDGARRSQGTAVPRAVSRLPLCIGSELFTGHNSWMGYHMMLRVFKRYEFGGLRPVAMTSYPGALVSGDDWFQVGNLTITETTLPNYNNEIFAAVTPKTVPYWIRAMVANQQARSGPDWMEVFAKHNSGTYNNMWIVVDYSKFEPYKPVREGLLTVGEQLPDFFYYEDQTAVLSYGYYPSYNAAAYPETARLIKQDKMAREKGEDFSYQMVSRAKVFRRDQADIRSDADMQRTMQYNQFKTDPLAKGDPCNQLACRADLDKDAAARQTFGAIDAKYTSSAHVRADRTLVISGPTKDDQPVFDWRAVDPALAAKSSHNGQPERFNFPWMVMGADMAASPWLGDASNIRSQGGAEAFQRAAEAKFSPYFSPYSSPFTVGVALTGKAAHKEKSSPLTLLFAGIAGAGFAVAVVMALDTRGRRINAWWSKMATEPLAAGGEWPVAAEGHKTMYGAH